MHLTRDFQKLAANSSQHVPLHKINISSLILKIIEALVEYVPLGS
jgi:hypothetical protein